MITNLQWIGEIDHRVSAAVVFFVLLLLLNNGERRRLFPLRAAVSFLVMNGNRAGPTASARSAQ